MLFRGPENILHEAEGQTTERRGDKAGLFRRGGGRREGGVSEPRRGSEKGWKRGGGNWRKGRMGGEREQGAQFPSLTAGHLCVV